jgi:hypothetical protein
MCACGHHLPQGLTWYQASAACKQISGTARLPEIRTAKENDDILTLQVRYVFIPIELAIGIEIYFTKFGNFLNHTTGIKCN